MDPGTESVSYTSIETYTVYVFHLFHAGLQIAHLHSSLLSVSGDTLCCNIGFVSPTAAPFTQYCSKLPMSGEFWGNIKFVS